jgi:peptidoglycan hydrolase-like protein with peptidoglycan-binding domain
MIMADNIFQDAVDAANAEINGQAAINDRTINRYVNILNGVTLESLGIKPNTLAANPTEPEAETEKFAWDKASNNGNLSFLKKGSKQDEQTKFLQESLQAVGLAADIPTEQFGHYGNKTTTAVKNLQEAFKDAGAEIKVDGGVYVESWAALAALKETGTQLVDGKIPDEAKEAVLAAYKANLGEAGKLVLGKSSELEGSLAAKDIKTLGNAAHLG